MRATTPGKAGVSCDRRRRIYVSIWANITISDAHHYFMAHAIEACMRQFKAAWERLAADRARLTEFMAMKRPVRRNKS